MNSKIEHRARMDAERNRAMDPATVHQDSAGKLEVEFVASYALPDGSRRSIGFWAASREDAQLAIAWMRQSIRFEGLAADFMPVRWEYRTPDSDD
jgi:hypothetical protein